MNNMSCKSCGSRVECFDPANRKAVGLVFDSITEEILLGSELDLDDPVDDAVPGSRDEGMDEFLNLLAEMASQIRSTEDPQEKDNIAASMLEMLEVELMGF
jgi:hypothetical protein